MPRGIEGPVQQHVKIRESDIGLPFGGDTAGQEDSVLAAFVQTILPSGSSLLTSVYFIVPHFD